MLDYLRSTEDVLREERVDALKNDILNVLREQNSIPPQLADTLISMFDSQAYDVAMLDYCIQHLGAIQKVTHLICVRKCISLGELNSSSVPFILHRLGYIADAIKRFFARQLNVMCQMKSPP